MRATAAPEEGNKVRLTVEIDEAEMDEALDDVMKRCRGRSGSPDSGPARCPERSSRPGWAVPSALRGEAIREALPEFYSRAVDETEVDPIDQPDIDITAGEESGPVSFEAVVLVRPTVAIPGYGGLVVTLPNLDVTDEEVTAQVDRDADEFGRAGRGDTPDPDRRPGDDRHPGHERPRPTPTVTTTT